MDVQVSFPLAFAAGVVSFLSPCILPVVPSYVAFVSGERLVAFLGESALTIVTRLMGMILTVIGTQMAIEGIRGAFNLTR